MLVDHFPLFGLRLTTPRLELRLPAGEELAALADVAAGGVHRCARAQPEPVSGQVSTRSDGAVCPPRGGRASLPTMSAWVRWYRRFMPAPGGAGSQVR